MSDQKQEFNFKQWMMNLVSMFIVGAIAFTMSTALHSWATDEINDRLNKQDVFNQRVLDYMEGQKTINIEIKDAIKAK